MYVCRFGSNTSGFENDAQLKMLGDYSMAVFGWQALLKYSNYSGELDLLVGQCQKVKARNPKTVVIVYIDGLRVEPFYSSLRKIMYDPNYEDFFLRNADGYIPATTYCAQMRQNHTDPKCLSWYWNWFNSSAVDYYLNELVLPQAQKPGFDGVFFDGSDGFMRGTWKQATNVKSGYTDDDALKVMVDVHVRGAQLLYAHQKYAVYSEHLEDTTVEQQAYVEQQMHDVPYFRFYEGFQPTEAYIDEIINETQKSQSLPLIFHQPLGRTSVLDSLAAFLIAHGNYSYYMASTVSHHTTQNKTI